MILTGVGFLAVTAVVLATDAAPETFRLGLQTMFTYPAVLLLAAQVSAVVGVLAATALVVAGVAVAGSAAQLLG